MSGVHDKKPKRVSEAVPVQVFLGWEDRALLDRLTGMLDISKSEVLRRSLAALERQLLDPKVHPALQVVGLVADDDGRNDDGTDAVVNHDRILAEEHDRYGAS